MTTFEDVIDQTTVGHEVLRRAGLVTAATPVRHGYQLDMFAGESSATPVLWSWYVTLDCGWSPVSPRRTCIYLINVGVMYLFQGRVRGDGVAV